MSGSVSGDGRALGVLIPGFAVGVGCSGCPVWPGSTMLTTPSAEPIAGPSPSGFASSDLTNTKLTTPGAFGWNVIVARSPLPPCPAKLPPAAPQEKSTVSGPQLGGCPRWQKT